MRIHIENYKYVQMGRGIIEGRKEREKCLKEKNQRNTWKQRFCKWRREEKLKELEGNGKRRRIKIRRYTNSL